MPPTDSHGVKVSIEEFNIQFEFCVNAGLHLIFVLISVSVLVLVYVCMYVLILVCVSVSVYVGKEMFYLTTHSTHLYLPLYGVRHMVKDHSDSEKGNPLPPHRLLFPISSKGYLYAPSHRQDSTYHSLCYTSRGALAGTRNSSMAPPHEGSIRRPIAP